MSIHWTLKSLAASKGLYKASAIQRVITEKTGVIISIQNICNLLGNKQQTIRLKTMEVICSALDCTLSDFCIVKPGKFDCTKVRKLSFQTTPHAARGKSSFPDPKDYS